jgi:5-formyltetrahydrofolate cyclo-ligase
MSQLDKSRLRRKILQQRQALSQEEWQTKSKLICDRLHNLSLFQSAKTILAYFSFRQEADLTSLFFLQKTWAFPRCVGQSLIWHLWQPGESLNFNKYNISEPLETSPIISPSLADLILVPTVACDQQGYRLGYGGGFYDRLLSSSEFVNIPTIGIVFDFAYFAHLPSDTWDIKLGFICTETKFSCY